ncbi:MAG: ZIP family metal transporter, partial [Solirubrobacterales bacterium]|nr:ZIP family metal transporter [Solirubrobacterales bacterium]
MEAGTAQRPVAGRAPGWLLGVAPLIVIGLSLIAFLALGGPGLGERTGPPVEEVAIERTVLRPGEIVLTLRNDGPDQVSIAQALVNDAFVPPSSPDGLSLERLGSIELTLPYDWVEGEAYEVALLTSTGATVDHSIPVAAETPETDLGFFGLMALLGLYVGVIPVSLGMLWLPFVRRIGRGWMRALMAFTVGLLAFLAIDAALEGLEIAAAAPAAFGGPALVFLGAIVSYLALVGVGAWLR